MIGAVAAAMPCRAECDSEQNAALGICERHAREERGAAHPAVAVRRGHAGQLDGHRVAGPPGQPKTARARRVALPRPGARLGAHAHGQDVQVLPLRLLGARPRPSPSQSSAPSSPCSYPAGPTWTSTMRTASSCRGSTLLSPTGCRTAPRATPSCPSPASPPSSPTAAAYANWRSLGGYGSFRWGSWGGDVSSSLVAVEAALRRAGHPPGRAVTSLLDALLRLSVRDYAAAARACRAAWLRATAAHDALAAAAGPGLGPGAGSDSCTRAASELAMEPSQAELAQAQTVRGGRTRCL